MIIDQFDIPGRSIPPIEADPPLAVYPDTPLPRPVADELFEAVRGWQPEVFNRFSLPQGNETIPRRLLKRLRERFHRSARCNRQRPFIGEALNHALY